MEVFQKELIFSIIGLSPERQISANEFLTKTGAYRIALEFRKISTRVSDVVVRIFATNAPILDGAQSFKDVRTVLNRKLDYALGEFKEVSRHSGTEGTYNIWLNMKGVELHTDGVEYCRRVLTRAIDCLEGG
ncbi:hypothetical protein [Thiococcus pfennigii]|uniref:hypothetical protein n=1 Tax=Thiococcus pfennigii TaxID=1057 RepID=UPI001908335F|nr:hypothetical protein [Thiococcus pfennigii]